MSATNLLPLLDQLQTMENTLSNFILETVLKLHSLTDMKVFFIVDSNQQRRYCGSKELTDVFERQGLICSQSTDICVRLDSTANSLVEILPPLHSTPEGTDDNCTMPTKMTLTPGWSLVKSLISVLKRDKSL